MRTSSQFFLCFPLIGLIAALWGVGPASGQSLYSDPVARQPGDVLTIVLAEQTSAQRESSYEGSSSSAMGGSGSAATPTFSGQFGGDAEISTETNTNNESVQSDLLEGTVTARVTDVNEAGNLLIEGERRLTVNGVTHVMEVSGVVRPSDVRHDNTVLSHQIAGANIKYSQAGFRHRGFFSRGLLLKAGTVAAIGLSVFLGLR